MDHTYIIESNRRTAYRQEFEFEKDRTIGTTGVDMPANRWRTTIPTGIKLNVGDEISVEASNINIRGDAGQTMEFTGGETNPGIEPVSDNSVKTKMGFYISNNMEFNFPLPTARHRINTSTANDSYGEPKLQTYTDFAASYPFQGIEGFNSFLSGATDAPDITEIIYGVMDNDPLNLPPMTNAPIEIFHPNSTRFYKLTKEELGLYNQVSTNAGRPITGKTWTELEILEYQDIDLSIDPGFITPSSVGDFLTAQLQGKTGEGDKWTTDEPAIQYSVLPGTNFGSNVNNILAKIKTNDFSTKSYKIFPTTCGDFAQAYYNNTWSGSYAGIPRANVYNTPSPVPTVSGTGYVAQEGHEMFWKNILTANIPQYLTAKMMSNICIKTLPQVNTLEQYAVAKLDGLEDVLFILDGGRPAQGTVDPEVDVPSFGQQLVLIDQLDLITDVAENFVDAYFCKWTNYYAGTRTNYPSTGETLMPPLALNEHYEKTTDIGGNAFLVKIDLYTGITTNIIATKGAVDYLKELVNTNAFPNPDPTYDFLLEKNGTSLLRKAQALVYEFRFGRADDEWTGTTCRQFGGSSQKDLFDVPATNQVNLANPFICNYYSYARANIPGTIGLRGYMEYFNLETPGGVGWTSSPEATNYFDVDIGTFKRMPAYASPYQKDKPQIKYFACWNDRFDPQHPATVAKLPASPSGVPNNGSYFTFKDPKGNYFDTSIFKPTGVGINEQGFAAYGVFLRQTHDDGTPMVKPVWVDPLTPDDQLYFTPYLSLVCAEEINPTIAGWNRAIAVPTPGEMMGVSRSIQDLQLSKIISTQKTIPAQLLTEMINMSYSPTDFSSLVSGTKYPNNQNTSTLSCTPFSYVSYIHIGANQPQISFDNGLGRFKITQLSTAKIQGNGSFSDSFKPVSTTPPGFYTPNENFTDEIITMYKKGCAITQYYAGFQMATAQTMLEIRDITGVAGVLSPYKNWGLPNYAVSQVSDPICPMNSSQSGIAILDIIVPLSLKPTELITLSSWKPFLYQGSLFDKMGFSLEQLLPLYGQQNSLFNRNTQSKYLGYNVSLQDKYNNMVKPATTNAFINGALSLNFAEDSYKTPMENLGAPTWLSPVITIGESDSIIASLIPKKLAYPYLIVHSDIIQSRSTFYGSGYTTTVPAIGFIQRNYDSSDFFYGFASSWRYVVDKSFILNDFIVDIVLPTGRPAPLDDDSSIIFKITKNQQQTIKPPKKDNKKPVHKNKNKEN